MCVAQIAGAVVVWEYNKSVAKDQEKALKKETARAKKEQYRQSVREDTERRLVAMEETLGEVLSRIDTIERRSRWFPRFS